MVVLLIIDEEIRISYLDDEAMTVGSWVITVVDPSRIMTVGDILIVDRYDIIGYLVVSARCMTSFGYLTEDTMSGLTKVDGDIFADRKATIVLDGNSALESIDREIFCMQG